MQRHQVDHHSAGNVSRRVFGLLASGSLITAALFVFVWAVNADDEEEANVPAAAPTRSPAPAPLSAYEGNQWQVVRPGEQQDYNQRQTLLHRGKRVYDMYCVGCHGEKGDGQGPATARLITPPRDFTSGIYKFRSTDSASLPMESDLHRTITRGLSRVSMPAFPLMPEHDKLAVIQYIKRFYRAWEAEASQRQKVFVPRAPADLHDAARVERGGLIYLAAGCYLCHGSDGAGTGATRIQYTDAWGKPQRAFNFTRGRLKGGDDPEDIYRTFHTGLRSIMPQYGADAMAAIVQSTIATKLSEQQQTQLAAQIQTFPRDNEALNNLSESARDALAVGNSWDLVAYVLSLRHQHAARAGAKQNHE